MQWNQLQVQAAVKSNDRELHVGMMYQQKR
jgi:hypothetical protein